MPRNAEHRREYMRQYYLKTKDRQRAYNKNWRAKEFQAVQDRAFAYLGGAWCIDCSYDTDKRALQFDHLPDRAPKHVNVGTLISYGRWTEKLREELDKCEVVCANCHCIRTATRKDT